jgi:hypothetical protein
MGEPAGREIVDVTDASTFRLIPPCVDPRFDHRSCDYWEDDVRGSKAARSVWWEARSPSPNPPRPASNPFAPEPSLSGPVNPFMPGAAAASDLDWSEVVEPMTNPFAPTAPSRSETDRDAPRKLQLLTRGQRAVGSYAKVMLLEQRPVAFAQFGPLSAYPRAQRIRELYPELPRTPLPAVITCIATTIQGRGLGLGEALVLAVCDDLGARGFAAVEAYPDLTLGPEEASAATPAFWVACGFGAVADDDRFPVMRRELD